MKTKSLIPILLIGLAILTSCKQSKEDKIKDFLEAVTSYDKEKIEPFLADNFIYGDKKNPANKQEYLNRLDSLKTFEYSTSLISVNDQDSVVYTEEKVINIMDSLLEVTPKLIQKKTYRFADDKIKSISIDSVINYDKYYETLSEKMVPFIFYVQDQYDIQDKDEIFNSLKKYLIEYSKISVSEKKKYRNYSSLQGTYISYDNPFYRKLVFKGKSTVVTIDAIFGFSFPSSYVLDEDYIRIKTDKSDLLLQIKDSKTLVGEGFASGTYTKTE